MKIIFGENTDDSIWKSIRELNNSVLDTKNIDTLNDNFSITFEERKKANP